MRVDGFSSSSYPIKRKPRKAQAQVDDADDLEGDFEVQPSAQRSAPRGGSVANLPARPQDMIFHRSMSRRVATALSSYLTTSTFVEWDGEVLGLDVHI
ncbi:hypothetical protein PMM47T1_04794 [Pseudomonas sp. M47T1]|uniref:hypothetical protein n=1 Tax=unclassified Pseudomonas TaxID=196821 RepID=UPI0002608277|nr:hypothetical protein [Pseudomonas sp. M47T1]EIK97801.1 hypothetical protein PMM47T1_04794 [Pseudomonas sp. M47T1]